MSLWLESMYSYGANTVDPQASDESKHETALHILTHMAMHVPRMAWLRMINGGLRPNSHAGILKEAQAQLSKLEWLAPRTDTAMLLALGFVEEQKAQECANNETMRLEDRIDRLLAYGKEELDRRPELRTLARRIDAWMDSSSRAPSPGSFWVLPGRLLAGPYPSSHQKDKAASQIGILLDWGIRHFIDLTRGEKSNGSSRLGTYRPVLQSAADSMGVEAVYANLPIGLSKLPSKHAMLTVLDHIDCALTRNRPVYVHCRDGIARIGLVIACYLVMHGLSFGQDVFKRIDALKGEDHGTYRCFPRSDAQHDYAISWKESPYPQSDVMRLVLVSERARDQVKGIVEFDHFYVSFTSSRNQSPILSVSEVYHKSERADFQSGSEAFQTPMDIASLDFDYLFPICTASW